MPSRVRYTLPERILHAATLSLFVLMGLSTLAQILFRYFLQLPLPWTEEAARVLFVLSMLMAIAFAYREGEHIIVDFLFLKLPGNVRRTVSILFNVAILCFLVTWARGAIQLADLNWGSSLVTLPFFRVSYLYMWEVAAIALTTIYVILDTAALLQGRKSHGPEAQSMSDS